MYSHILAYFDYYTFMKLILYTVLKYYLILLGWKIIGKAFCSSTDRSSILQYLIRPDRKRKTFLSQSSTIMWAVWFQRLAWWRLRSCCCRITALGWCWYSTSWPTTYVDLYYKYTVSPKMKPLYFLNNSVKSEPVLMTFCHSILTKFDTRRL